MAGEATKGEITLLVNISDAVQDTGFHVIKGDTRYNSLLGRPWIHNMKAVPSTLHQMMKFPTKGRNKMVYGEKHAVKEMFAVHEEVLNSAYSTSEELESQQTPEDDEEDFLTPRTFIAPEESDTTKLTVEELEQGVLIENLPDQKFRARAGWDYFIGHVEDAYEHLVKEFYTNVTHIKKGTTVIKVWNLKEKFDGKTINDYLGFPEEDQSLYLEKVALGEAVLAQSAPPPPQVPQLVEDTLQEILDNQKKFIDVVDYHGKALKELAREPKKLRKTRASKESVKELRVETFPCNGEGIDVEAGELTFRVGDKKVVFHVCKSMKKPNSTEVCSFVDLVTTVIVDDTSAMINVKDPLEVVLLNMDVNDDASRVKSVNALHGMGSYSYESRNLSLDLENRKTPPTKPSIEEPPVEATLEVLQKQKKAIRWTLDDIRGISPSFCMHKIILEEDAKPSLENQRRLNEAMQEVVKKEVIK
ncbi:uncharacterized protein [Nicotiana sylvestris]|uniref:uncharacterized protein n=1 Tax=Nicotiana sylvestris TaxID=4096 RepID=UPI00388CA5E1